MTYRDFKIELLVLKHRCLHLFHNLSCYFGSHSPWRIGPDPAKSGRVGWFCACASLWFPENPGKSTIHKVK